MNEDKLVLNKLFDKQKLCFNKNITTNTKFLNEHELSICITNLKFCNNFKACGGFLQAQRKLIIFVPDYIDIDDAVAPIAIIRADIPKKVSHRDVLGSLMGIGIKRETIGDILIFDDYVLIFSLLDVCDFILLNLIKISNFNVSLSKVDLDKDLVISQDFKIITDTVSTIRLDSILSSGFSISRSKAQDFINASVVFLNDVLCTKSDAKVNIGDKISIRKKGKIVLNDILGKSKKDRIFIEIKRYI